MSLQSRGSALAGLTPLVALWLAACSGSHTNSGTGQMQLAVADAPVDGATSVVVKFTGAELTGDSGMPTTINFASPKTIDLMTQSGTASAVLFNQPVPAGTYGQIRLLVEADGNPSNSFMIMSDGSMHGLNVPSGSQTGLKLVTGFTVPASGVVDYTIDFDLRQAITCPTGAAPACTLKPVERLVEDTSVGNIQGTVATALITTGCTPAVYLYSGNVSTPEDYNSMAAAGDMNQPIASRMPVANSSPPYYYQFTFLPPGTYTVAFTCQAAQDNPNQADAAVKFTPVTTGIAVSAAQTTSVDLS